MRSASDGRVRRPDDAGPPGDLAAARVAATRAAAGAAGRLAAARGARAPSARCASPRASGAAAAASGTAGAAIHNNQIPLVASGPGRPVLFLEGSSRRSCLLPRSYILVFINYVS